MNGEEGRTMISIDQLIKLFEEHKGQKTIIEINGIISTKIIIEKINAQIEDGYIIIEEVEDKEQKIKLNMHQLMKVIEMEKDVVLLEFDQLQNVKITFE